MANQLKSYLITDPAYYSNNIVLFKENLTQALEKNKVDIACFRDKKSENFEELALIFVEVCKSFNIDKILINTDFNLAKKLKATGVHLNSKQFNKIKEAKKLGLYVVISCHESADIQKAKAFLADAITYSPIYKTPNKGEPLGIENFKEIVALNSQVNIIALGGIINKKQIEEISKTKAYAFASIRYFI